MPLGVGMGAGTRGPLPIPSLQATATTLSRAAGRDRPAVDDSRMTMTKIASSGGKREREKTYVCARVLWVMMEKQAH